jgi:adenylate kinase family enzyme
VKTLDEYLSGQYEDDKGKLREIEELVYKVLPVFVAFQENGTWPYKVSESEVRKNSKKPRKRISISTHSMILFTLEAIRAPQADSVLIPSRSPGIKIKFSKALKDALSKGWERLRPEVGVIKERKSRFCVKSGTWGSDDPITLSWLCELARRCQAGESLDNGACDLDSISRELFRSAIDTSKRDPKGPLKWKKGEKRTPNANSFLPLRCSLLANAARMLRERDSEKVNANEQQTEKKLWFEKTINDQLAFSAIPDSRFDPGELAFALEGLLQLDRHILSSPAINHILETLEAAQGHEAHWRPVTPLFSTDQGMVLFPVSVEIACSLLRTCDILDRGDRRLPTFSRFEPIFHRYFDWLQARVERGVSGDDEFVGWPSEHVNATSTIHLWETSLVLNYLVHYSAMLQQKIAADGLRAAKLTPRLDVKKNDDYWDQEPLRPLAPESTYNVLSSFRNQFVDTKAKHGSMLLYGPPGTGKTTLAEQLAVWTNRPLLVITVSDFLAGGAAEVEALAKGIFQVLAEQDGYIILFDEIDEFLLDRDSDDYKKQTGIFKFLTPGMLTKFQKLKENEKSIFIVATNYADRIDSAIKRRGRIEERRLLSLPGKEQRIDFIKRFLQKYHKDLSPKIVQQLAEGDCSPEVMEKSVFFGYGDLKLAVKACSLDSETELDALATELVDQFGKITPSVRLEAYANRFEGGGKVSTVPVADELIEEFFLLVYLLAEVPKPRRWDTKKDAIARVLCCIGREGNPETTWAAVEERLSQAIKDDKVATSVIQWLKGVWPKQPPECTSRTPN